ncbi:MAG TPA: Flp pilus assembly protein CpaB [Acidobacteriaceae bacterium]|nr:Flp pilus assembly protein CpaB [Acidobacteriaceae bacterium]
MKAKRLMMALLVALVISGVFTFWLSRRIGKSPHVAAPVKQLVVAPQQTIEAGDQLKPGTLRLMEWPVSLPGSFNKVDAVAGRIALFPIAKDQPILNSYLAPAGAGVGLTAKIPSGMRAVSVRSDEVVGVAGFLLPGTHVDVLLTYHSEKSPDPRTVTVLQDVVVLAAGQQIRPDPEGRPISVTNSVVTFLLNPEDSEKLVLATSLGAIHFVLRNGADSGQESAPSIGIYELTGTPAPSSPGAAAIPAAEQRKPYQVETILGTKQVVRSFY